MDDRKAGYQATQANSLELQIMSSNVPKNEREHWAARKIASLRERLSAAEKERGEAVAYALAMRKAMVEARESLQFANDSPGGGIDDTIWMMHGPQTLFDYMDAALDQSAPAALSHLRQEIRREVLLELAGLMDKGAGMSAAGLRDLAEQEKQG
jgi:hypothetical protein